MCLISTDYGPWDRLGPGPLYPLETLFYGFSVFSGFSVLFGRFRRR